jgi:hypothetical protein
MATIIDLGKIRFEYKGVYSGATTYEVNDVIKYGGNVYVYTYGLATAGNVPTNTTYWDLMMEGFNFEGVFNTGTTYNIGDAFSHGGIVYIVTANTVVGETPPNASYYSTFVDGLQFEGAWAVGTAYQKADIVTYGGKSYVALQDTTGNIPSSSGAQWSVFADGLSVLGTYSDATAYKKGDIVTYGGTTYNALQDTSAGTKPSAGAPNWNTFLAGLNLRDSFDSANAYVKDDVVLFGANLFKAKGDVTGTHPLNTISWDPFLSGFSYVGTWNTTRKYFPGELVTNGGNLYQAIISSTNISPSANAATWSHVSSGITNQGTWTTATAYYPGDLVQHGGSTYTVEVTHTAGTFSADLAANRLAEFAQGVRNRGTWANSTLYLKDDLIQSGTSTYIATQDYTSTSNFANDESDGKWSIFASGAAGVLPTISGIDVGKSLVVKTDASGFELGYTDNSPNTYYVGIDGAVDDSYAGRSLQRPFASVAYCMQRIAAEKTADSSAQVFIKDGEYREALPMTIPADTTVFGDGQRNTTISPIAGDSNKTMFFVNSGVLIKEIKFTGLTGFALHNSVPEDIEQATIGGVFFRLDPTAVITKSPYIKECSAFSVGGIGCLIDGGLNNDVNNAGSMVFHTFTQIHSGGVGFWVRRNGKAEIVSCFTYYCDIGYASSGGGQIRSLNGNNSYGEYGTISTGNDSSEVTLNGSVRGFNLDYVETSIKNGEFTKGGIVRAQDRAKALNTISKTDPARVTTTLPHGVTDGHRVNFSNLLPITWNSGSQPNASEYYADVQDSYSFNLYSNAGLSSSVSGEAWGGRVVTNTSISDITRSNPMAVTVASHSLDSYDLIRIQGVGGMTQANDRYFLVMDNTSSIIKLKEAENNYIGVSTSATNYVITGTAGGVAHSAAVEPGLTVYKGSRYYFDVDSTNTPGFYLTTADPASSWGALQYTGEYTTGVTGSRAIGGGRLAITIDSTAPSTLYYANGNTASTYGTITVAAPGDVDATSYSVYSSGGQLRKTDSGDALISGTGTLLGTKATIIDHQPGANKLTITGIIGTGFDDGDSIIDSGNVAGVYAILTNDNAAHNQYGATMSFTGLTGSKPKTGGSVEFIGNLGDSGYDSIGSYVIQSVGDYDSSTGNAVLVFAQQKTSQRPAPNGQQIKIRYKYSQARLTGHDFLNIGFGNKTETNYPGDPSLPVKQGNEVIERETGRVFYVSTDQSGNFRVGNYFRIDQATGRATLDASAFDLSGLTSLRLGSIGAQLGEAINEFSADGTLSGNSNLAVPTEQAVKTYVDLAIEGASSQSLPKNAKAGGLATELFLGFDIKDLTKNDGINLK